MKRPDWRLVLGVLVGIALTAWFFAGVTWSELFATLATVDLRWIALSTLFMTSEWLLRGLRWGILLRASRPGMPLYTAVSATVIGAAVNTVLPLRTGDVVRPAVLARATGLSFATALTSTIVERIFDAASLLAIFAMMVWLLPPGEQDTGFMHSIRIGGLSVAGLGSVLLVGVVLLGTRQARGVAHRVGKATGSRRLHRRIVRVFGELADGLRVAGQPSRLLACLLFSALIVVAGFIGIWCLFTAFGMDLPYAAVLFIEGAVPLAIAVPQAPGYWGVFQAVIENVLELWHAPIAQAKAAALVFWAICFVPPSLWGLFESWRQGVDFLHAKDDVMGDLAARDGKMPDAE